MPAFVYILLAIFLLLLLLLITKIKVYLCYDDSLRVYAEFLFFKFNIIPSKQRKKKKKKSKKSNSTKANTPSNVKSNSVTNNSKEKSAIQKLFDVREALLALIKKFFKRLHFRFIVLKVNIGTDNAATTAILYGAVNQGVSYLLESLKSISKVDITSNSDISINADFLSQKSDFKAKIVLYLHVASLIHVGIHAIITHFKIKSTKEDKNGTDKAK